MKSFFVKLIKTLILTSLCMYCLFTLVNQQITIMEYRESKSQYVKKIQEEKLKSEQLSKIKNDITTSEYIEGVAREKLGLVMPNEIVFVDASI